MGGKKVMKSKIVVAIISGVCSIICAGVGNICGQKMVEEKINNQISQKVNVNVEGMGYEKSVDYILRRIDELEDDLEKAEEDNEELKKELEQKDASSSSSDAKTDKSLTDGVMFQDVLEVLYDGDDFDKYDGKNKFSVGGKEYRYGFTVGCDRGLGNFGPGCAKFNLDGKYSKMTFNVGKVDGYKANATVIVTSQSGIDKSYPVSADDISQPIEIDLKHTNDLKITVDSERTVEYGFFDIYFYE